ncbi:pentapeptide repeat-containing protein [Bacillus subtilis]|uniref:pentapeptide repeat-containing protein n=1 Tax=Bacillus subtilis TaxID=1423 RepID=UPI001C22BE42|nr:pentapeptide repeat-containing protein [Bacillus subtilis]MBU8571209.1 pentapeptide repeat-containing protein [Bacillus subtilis]MBU8624029.1 pentapeptide repeat-containing protein [Bacillus subtilis]MCY9207413.1 pentapeptide repeat-containing protein [Bacillus subtilis]MEC1581759.1 pentapeptide repeat-containing protein [Bacillus subtilis]
MSAEVTLHDNIHHDLSADCQHCFGLCCVALPYAKSADFAFNKDGGTPCRNLQSNYQCSIHKDLREKGFRGCSAYECFGAGQKVSQITYEGKDWRNSPETANEMFDVFPIMQQLHEMLWYLHEALSIDIAKPIHPELRTSFEKIERLTRLSKERLLTLQVDEYRAEVNEWLLKTSELVRAQARHLKLPKKVSRGSVLIGAKLKGLDLRGANLRGALLIAADLRNADLRMTDFIGADMRDADLSGANLIGSIFLTQAQVNAANGDSNTKLPPSLRIPAHWK